MFVAASSECFPKLSLDSVFQRLVDLEYTSVEIACTSGAIELKPSQVYADLDAAIAMCRETYRLTIAAYSVDIDAPEDLYYKHFAACCRLAKATKVVALVVPAAELGTPFNAEIERLRELVSIAAHESVQVGVKTETGRVTQDPDTAAVLCDKVKGLGITLDPSHFIYGPHSGGNYEQLMKYVYHTHLRDTTRDKLQVRVGQGQVEYGKLISQLAKVHYNRALSVNITETDEVDHNGEMRKMRLLPREPAVAPCCARRGCGGGSRVVRVLPRQANEPAMSPAARLTPSKRLPVSGRHDVNTQQQVGRRVRDHAVPEVAQCAPVARSSR